MSASASPLFCVRQCTFARPPVCESASLRVRQSGSAFYLTFVYMPQLLLRNRQNIVFHRYLYNNDISILSLQVTEFLAKRGLEKNVTDKFESEKVVVKIIASYICCFLYIMARCSRNWPIIHLQTSDYY